MSDKTYFSEKLGLNFKVKNDKNEKRRVVFQDNVNYNDYEMEKIKDCNSIQMKNIHNLKKIFGGVVL
jgi:hypothetical protein